MNILGYISAILILIGIAFQGYYFNAITDRKLQDNLKGYHIAFQKLKKEYIKQQFDLIPEKKSKTNLLVLKNTSDKIKNPSVKLKKEITPYCMRLNLWSYRNINIDEPENFFILEKLISNLYKNSLILEENIPSFTKKLVLAIQARKNKTIYLEQLKFKSLLDQEIYYKMLKGKEKVYPSFLKYINISEDTNPSICLACSDFIMLKTIFNEDIARSLTHERKNSLEQLTIDKNTFHAILLSNGNINHLPKISLKHKKSKLKEITISSTEEKTQIQLNQIIQLKTKIPS
jgi:hypothetical protein